MLSNFSVFPVATHKIRPFKMGGKKEDGFRFCILTVSSLAHVFDGVFKLDESFLVGRQSLKNKEK